MLRHWPCLAIVFFLIGCGGRSLPTPGSESYLETVSAFYTGVAAMEVGEDLRASAKLTRVTELVPEEPAAWANLALMALRRNELQEAQSLLTTALELDTDNSQVLLLAAAAAAMEGAAEQELSYLRRAAAADSTHVKAAYALFKRTDDAGEAGQLLTRLQSLAPDNTAILLDVFERAAASGGDAELVQLEARPWGPEVNDQIAALREAAETSDRLTQLAFLRNVLLSDPVYRQDLADLRVPMEQVGEPLVQFVAVERPGAAPAPPDESLEFEVERLLQTQLEPQTWIAAVALGNESLPAIFFAGGDSLRTLRGETWQAPRVSGNYGAAGIDYDFDFRTDLVLAGQDGIRLVRQDSTEEFADMTATLGLPVSITEAAYSGVWVADLDLEGDVDVVLAADEGPVQSLRNNGDGTFTPVEWFSGVSGLADFAWADLDQDGDPDAALVDEAGVLHLYSNERQGRFVPFSGALDITDVVDITITDSNSDGKIDLLALTRGGIARITGGFEWTVELVAAWDEYSAAAQLHVADVDNNGGIDLIISTPEEASVWLQDGNYEFRALPQRAEAHVFGISAIRDAGQLDLIGLDGSGQPVRVAIYTTLAYHWRQIRPRAAQAVGDQRINSFGIGGEVELRSGLLYQKQPITEPILHFGMGTQSLADVARITWPNGSVQAEFDMLSDQVVSAQQRLKGSCPWLFAWNGESMEFVTDFIWRSPLGLRINAQETAGVMTTEDWVRVKGDQLKPGNGLYDLRITAELWETHFFDHVSLMVVDHPAGSEIFVDERFAFPPPELQVFVTGETTAVDSAWDDSGRNVTEYVTAADERYLDFFGRGDYQGITRDHFVEFVVSDADSRGQWLVARGWIRPTDSSINVAISQGNHAPPQGLRLEAQRPDGSWYTVHANLGFPSGKSKTILADLEPALAAGATGRFRMYTNMEIYWDALHTAPKSAEEVRVQRLNPVTAQLRFRGYSVVTEANRSSPELPDYNQLSGTAQMWRDLVGYYTRFGPVEPLLETTDDRYVIMNAGDELVLHFAEVPPPAEGWVRDFVLIGDGWVKDGDYNTTFSTTLRPLPAHNEPRYDTMPDRLRDEPVYRLHPSDWRTYHTRYVTPEQFSRGLYFSP
ncbi:MAG: FG-GAP-like repeat-containing protein [Bacteroidota bacterium]|nr:FG-GAP-like repeat-containing protein [Bacteroidota bacterium]